MHVVITGAAGFVGAALARRILAMGLPGMPILSRLTLVDRHIDGLPNDARVQVIAGDFGALAVLDMVFDTPVDVLFHLASVPGGQAEREFSLGYQVNLIAPLTLFQRVATQGAGRVAHVVYASSIAVYGSVLPEHVDADTPARPGMSYGAHKLAGEIVLADLSRRGMVHGISLRLPGIVARPGLSGGHGSAFMSAIMRAAEAGMTYDCPVSPQASCWWMSVECCVDNLLHAATVAGQASVGADRAVTLPVLRLQVDAVVAALARRFGKAAAAGIRFQPEPAIEQVFGRMPAMANDAAWRLGFRHDGDADLLVRRSLATG